MCKKILSRGQNGLRELANALPYAYYKSTINLNELNLDKYALRRILKL